MAIIGSVKHMIGNTSKGVVKARVESASSAVHVMTVYLFLLQLARTLAAAFAPAGFVPLPGLGITIYDVLGS